MDSESQSYESTISDNKKRKLLQLKLQSKKKKRRKDLEQLRRNVLITNRNFKQQSVEIQQKISNQLSKNPLKKTLSILAKVRQEHVKKTQRFICQERRRNLKKKSICGRFLPEPILGIFKNGAEGKEIRKRSATNHLLYREHKTKQKKADVRKLFDDNTNYSPYNKTTLNSVDKLKNLNEDEKNGDKGNYCSIPHHRYQLFNVIKGDCTSNNQNSVEEISNCVKMKSNETEIRMSNSIILENARTVLKNKRKNEFKTQFDNGNYNTIRCPRIVSSYSLKMGTVSMQKELKNNAIVSKMQSIKRWSTSSVHCYDELCSNIYEENFFFSFAQSHNSDPIIQIRKNLASLLAEVLKLQENANHNDLISSMSCIPVTAKISFPGRHSVFSSPSIQTSLPIYLVADEAKSDQTRVYNHTRRSWEMSKIMPLFRNNHLNSMQNMRIDSNKKLILMNSEKIHDEKDEFLENSIGVKQISQSFIEHLKSMNHNHLKTSRNLALYSAKHAPTMLLPSNSELNVSIDIDFTKSDQKNDLRNFQEINKKTKKSTCKNHANTNEFLVNSEIKLIHGPLMISKPHNEIINEFDNHNNHNHNININNNNEMKKKEYFNPMNTRICTNRRTVSRHIGSWDTTDFQQSLLSPLYASNYSFSNNIMSDSITPVFSLYSEDFYGQTDLKHVHEMNNETGSNSLSSNRTSSLRPIPSEYCNGFRLKSVQISNVNQSQDLHISRWRMSEFGHNISTKPMNFISNKNEQNLLQRHAEYYPNANVEINDTVLHYFKGLSFREDKIDRSSLLNDSFPLCAHKKKSNF